MLIFSVLIFVFSTLSLSPSPFASKSGGHDPTSSYGSAAPGCEIFLRNSGAPTETDNEL